MPIIKYIFAIIFISILYSCGKSLDGKIENREGNRLYLVNESKTKEFKFTIKQTEIINDTIFNYRTRIIPLSAGDEKFLGYIDSETVKRFPEIEAVVLKTYPINEKPKKRINSNVKNLSDIDFSSFDNIVFRDTIIKGERLKYEYATELVNDSLHPFPTVKYVYKYEVTGQIEIKDKQLKNDYSISNK